MITREQLQDIGNWLIEQPIDDKATQRLRETYPGLHFTWCMDDDVVAAKPVYEHSEFNLYLVDSRNHCLSFTQDLDAASGLVVAEIEDE